METGKAFQSTRPIRGATSAVCVALHGLLISIHAPHTGRDSSAGISSLPTSSFQSTRPIRGATTFKQRVAAVGIISIHAPHTGRDPCRARHRQPQRISIHAPHTGRDLRGLNVFPVECISIHAPHTGRDASRQSSHLANPNFNPRAPYGARQQKCIIYVLHFCNNRQSRHKNQRETSSVRTFF